MAQVFISYARKDLAFVEQLAADLKSAGLDVWYDVSRLGGGSRWMSEIEAANRNSEFVIVVLSPDSMASEWVDREFMFASRLKRKVIPLMYRSCDLTLNYLNLNYIDVQGDNYKRNFDAILRALRSQETPSPSENQSKNTASRPLAWNANPILYVTVLVILSMLIGSNLLTKWYYSREAQKVMEPVQKATEMIPTHSISFTPTVKNLLTSTSASVLPTSTILPTPPADFWISYNSDVNGNRDIFLLNPKTGEEKAVITDPSHDKVGTWSPNGRFLAFESNRSSTIYYQIYLFDSDQGSITRLTELAECSNWAPAWSPDGKRIVFYSSCEGARDIYMMNRDGTGRKKLTSGSGENKFPVFSPDGNSIAFTSSRGGRDQIWLMNVDGSNTRKIADGCSATFSPDGSWLWFSTTCEDSAIQRIQISSLNLSTIGGMPGHNPSVSPDGQFVVFQTNNDIWIMDIDGSNPTQLTSRSAVEGAPTWRP
jgi:TolB protein